MTRILCICILVCVGFSCSSDSSRSVLSDFNNTINLKLNVSPIESTELGEILDMVSFDSILIINEVFEQQIFKYFNVNNGNLGANFINRGKGPNELIFPGLMCALDDSIFSTYEANKKQLVYFNVYDIIANFHQFEKVTNTNLSDLVIFQSYPINDSLVIFTGMFEDGKYCLYNSKSENTIITVDFPDDENHQKENNYIKSMAHQGEIAIKPNKQKFVFVCRHGYFDICSVSQNELLLENRKLYYLSDYKVIGENVVAHSAKSAYAFHSVEVTDNYIYMIYSGRTKDEFGSEYIAGNNILVYDWNGNPVVNFKTDRYLHRMTLDRNNLIIYGFCINSVTGEPEIVTCQLPKH
jgi:hypothetical protein